MTPASHHTYPIQMLFIFNNESISNADANQSFLLSYFLKIVLSFKYEKLKLGFALRYQDSGALQNSHHGSALNCIFPLHSTIWSALHVHTISTTHSKCLNGISQTFSRRYFLSITKHCVLYKLHQSNTSSATAMVRIVCTPISTHSPPVCFGCLHQTSPVPTLSSPSSLGAVHILRQPILGVFRPPLPPSSAIVSNCLTPPPLRRGVRDERAAVMATAVMATA